MPPLFHVSSVRNRESILAHGLDWARMGAAPGIAGSHRPEENGIFLSRDEFDVGFFLRMNNTGGPVDVWAVDGIDERHLVMSGNGFEYVPFAVSTEHLTLVRSDVEPAPDRPMRNSGSAYGSTLTVTLDDDVTTTVMPSGASGIPPVAVTTEVGPGI